MSSFLGYLGNTNFFFCSSSCCYYIAAATPTFFWIRRSATERGEAQRFHCTLHQVAPLHTQHAPALSLSSVLLVIGSFVHESSSGCWQNALISNSPNPWHHQTGRLALLPGLAAVVHGFLADGSFYIARPFSLPAHSCHLHPFHRTEFQGGGRAPEKMKRKNGPADELRLMCFVFCLL